MSLELIPLPGLLREMTARYGKKWYDLEVETISLDLGIELSPLMYDKLHVLRLMCEQPDLFQKDLMFFAHAVSIMNNIETDPMWLPEVTSLEIAYALVCDAVIRTQLQFPGDLMPSEAVQHYIKHRLVEDGYGELVAPFSQAVSPEVWGPSVPHLEGDLNAKKRAIKSYLEEMLKEDTND